MSDTYKLAKRFKRKYPLTVAWRLRSHCKVIDMHLNKSEGEESQYLFMGQMNENPYYIVNTNVIVLTNKRIMVATKRIVFGYFFISITPEMYNDLTIKKGLLWGTVIIDTIKENCYFTNIDPKALPEIETNITEIMARVQKECEVPIRRNKAMAKSIES